MAKSTGTPEILVHKGGNIYNFRPAKIGELDPRPCIGCGEDFTPHPWNPDFPAHGVSCLVKSRTSAE